VGGFDHVVLAIKLPGNATDPSLIATMDSSSGWEKILFYDLRMNDAVWTDWGIPAGQLWTPRDAGRWRTCGAAKQPSTMNSVRRTAKLTLDETGKLKGEVSETRIGIAPGQNAGACAPVTKDADRISRLRILLAGSMSLFHITHATILNLSQTDSAFRLQLLVRGGEVCQ